MSDEADTLVLRTALPKMLNWCLVPSGRSLPADSQASSFLTTFPPEIRNLIYEALFVSSGRLETIKDSPGHEGWHWYEDMNPSLKGSPELSRLKIALATPFLRSCHQVYHQAIGILYSYNEFMLRPHRPMPAFDTWSRDLGSQMVFVRKVFVGVHALYGTVVRADRSDNGIEILRILRLLWATKSSKLDIVITKDVVPRYVSSYGQWDMVALNRILLLLRLNDAMDIEGTTALGCSHLS
jgi:hypothetical protein